MKKKTKLNIFLSILEDSQVGPLIHNAIKNDTEVGRKSYNPYRLFATIIYGFAKHSGSVRKIEESLNFDLRFIT